MKKTLLLLVSCLFVSSVLLGQDFKIQFSYDASGNQTLRDRICANCPSARAVLVDSTFTKNLEETAELPENIENGSKVIAYPNPVTDILTVEWIENNKEISQITLFSGAGRQLLTRKITNSQGSVPLHFDRYPRGNYIVYVQYTDNTKQSFQIIKK